MTVLGNVGGQAISILAIAGLFLSHYQRFSYYSDALKSLYYKRENEIGEEQIDGDWHSELRSKFKSRQPFEQGYCVYIFFLLLASCCCCCTDRW